MADVTYLRLHHDPDSSDDQTLIPFPPHDFNFDFDFDCDFLDPLSHRQNQVNFVMDLFHQRVEQSHSIFDPPFSHHHEPDHFFLGSPRSHAPFHNCAPLAGFGSDSDSDEDNNAFGIFGVNSDEDYNENDDVSSIPLCWDSLQLEDNNNRDNNNYEDFEWEEVDGRVDERDVLSMLALEDDSSLSVSVSPITEIGEEGDLVSVGGGGMENLEWQVLLNSTPDLEHDAEPYFGDNDDYIYTAEYEMMFGQFAENDSPLVGRPPASVSVVGNLLSVVVTQDEVEKNHNTLCAVCKEEFCVGERVKMLPCSHRYHGDCIVPWLGIRNTCPVCRYEFPTDDADYERSKARRSAPIL
ncbi:hypothetical protein RJT34_32011 [Clitoria ternatea]|uniref:RING-type E3 ubiquitin transferase n=1 Tax=Clitoria ternatea TaxID=43366 RepID=A0AAN9EVL8_CLITE